MGNKPGGGIGSRAMGKPTQYFVGKPSNIIRPAGVAQLGAMQGDHTMQGDTRYRGEKMLAGTARGQVPMGNQMTMVPAKPGGGRNVMRCGSQGGVSPSPSIATKDTLAEYGPDYQNSRTRR